MSSRVRSLVLLAMLAALALVVGSVVLLLLPASTTTATGSGAADTAAGGEPSGGEPSDGEDSAVAGQAVAGQVVAGEPAGETGGLSPASPSPAAPPGEALPSLYVDPGSPAAQWLAANPGSPLADEIAATVVPYPAAVWLRAGEPRQAAEQVADLVARAAADGTTPVVVSAAPGLSGCEPALAGAPAGDSPVTRWYEAVASAIGDGQVIVVVEPFALGRLSCVRDDAERRERLDAVARAVDQLGESAPQARVYLGGGGWAATAEPGSAAADPAVMAERLVAAGVDRTRGFLVNSGGARPLPATEAYAAQVNARLTNELGRPLAVAVDTGRNGAAPPPDPSCNAAGLRTGATPGPVAGAEPAAGGTELRLWLLQPGVSEGDCGLGAGSSWGAFLPELAVAMTGEQR